MRIVNKKRLEGILGKFSRQSIPLGNYALIYGQTDSELREAEEKERVRRTYMDYFELCRHAAMCHPAPYASFARMHD